jgi:hypothetical protein
MSTDCLFVFVAMDFATGCHDRWLYMLVKSLSRTSSYFTGHCLIHRPPCPSRYPGLRYLDCLRRLYCLNRALHRHHHRAYPLGCPHHPRHRHHCCQHRQIEIVPQATDPDCGQFWRGCRSYTSPAKQKKSDTSNRARQTRAGQRLTSEAPNLRHSINHPHNRQPHIIILTQDVHLLKAKSAEV